MMTVSTFRSSGEPFPTLRFGSYPWWARFFYGIRFLPEAFRAIQQRRLTPEYSFHLIDVQERAIGISEGNIRYPAAAGELQRLQPLIIYLEDRRFFRHFGIDIRGIARAAAANIRFFGIVQGGSTITQQLVRNTLLVSERSILRKLFEVLLAVKLEKHYSKREILNLYCNHVYLGKGVRGFPAAAKIIFRRKLSALNSTQICGLLGLLRTPARTFPDNDGADFLTRQHKVSKILKFRNERGDQPSTKPNPIKITNHRCPRFTQIVKSELVRLSACMPSNIRRVGLTIDNSVQNSLSGTLREITRLPDITSAAGVIISTATADVLAEVAYESGHDAQFSPTYFGLLQPGSTFKTFALLSALQQGISLDQPLISAPFESSCFRGAGNTVWRVRNYANVYRGVISLNDAFKYSDNTAFARLVEMLDIDQVFSLYREFGLCADAQGSPAIVLGGHKSGVSLLSLIAAYRAIANGGLYMYPRFIQYAEFGDGSFTPFPRSRETRLVFEFNAIRDLQAALIGAGPVVRGIKYAGKTGTTRTGSLFVGYNDQIASAIWVGYGRPITEGDPKAVGAIATFERFMNKVLGHRSDLISI
jgi:penicillin-binding protein 1A